MTGILLRVLIIGLIIGAIYLGVRRIWRDWTRNFRDIDAEKRNRDLKERKRPDVITLRRSNDGVFRPGEQEEDERR
jgi:hypothetical protein